MRGMGADVMIVGVVVAVAVAVVVVVVVVAVVGSTEAACLKQQQK